MINLSLMADSHELRLMHVAAAADGCISAGIENFLFFRNAHFCRIRTCQMQLVWISLNLGMKNVSKLLIFDSKLNKKFLFDELLRWIEVIWLIEDYWQLKLENFVSFFSSNNCFFPTFQIQNDKDKILYELDELQSQLEKAQVS